MAVEVTISLLKKKLENLLGDKDMVYPRFRTRVNRAIEELQELQACLAKAESVKGSDRPNLPPELLRDLYSVYDIVDSFRLTSSLRRPQLLLKKMRPFAWLMSGWSQFYLSRKLKIEMRSQFLSSRELEKLVIKVEKLEDNLEGVPDQPPAPGDAGARGDGPSEAGSQDQERSPSNWDQFAPSTEESDIVGMDDQAEDLARTVLAGRRSPFLVWVVGPLGSGKTTLVRKVCTRVDVKQHFQRFAWVSVPREFNELELLIEVLRQVKVVVKEENLAGVRHRVRESFLDERCLIVLDDIQSTQVWENIKFALANPSGGSKVVLIMREAKDTPPVERRPGSTILKVRPLTEEESWVLFLKKVRTAVGKSIESELIKLKEKIWIKSDGLPLAVVLLGGLLSTKKFDPREWSKVIDNATLNIEQSILAAGYHDLPSPLKACLLYLGLFPRSYEVPIRRLLLLWIAEGLAMTSAGETEAPEDTVEGYLKELVKRNMVEVARWRLDGSPRTCRVPGILYDTLFPSAAQMGFFHVHSNSNYSDKHVWRLAEYSDIGGYPDDSDPYKIQHLRSYVSFNIRKGDSPTDGFDKLLKKIVARRGFGLLTVLDLEHVYKPVLSETLGKLLYLKYLGLRWTFLDSVPASIAKLSCLETLDVKHTNITTLPISIWKATNLRHLYMNDIHFDVSTQVQNSSSMTESLSKLRTLWGLLIGNSSVVKWLQRLASLRKLGLTCHESSMQEIVDWICGLTNLQSLRLRSIDKFNRPSELNLKSLRQHNDLKELYLLGKLSRGNIYELPQNLKILTLSVSYLKEDPMLILGKLRHLNILRLFARSFMGKEMKCLRYEFPKLHVLKLWLLEELERWTVERGSLLRLKALEIRCCTKLELPGGLKHVMSLKELTLTDMPEDFAEKMKAEMSSNKLYIKVNNWDLPNSRENSPPVPNLCSQCRKKIEMDAEESLDRHKPK